MAFGGGGTNAIKLIREIQRVEVQLAWPATTSTTFHFSILSVCVTIWAVDRTVHYHHHHYGHLRPHLDLTSDWALVCCAEW